MACITATVTIPTISATASVPTYGAEVNVDLRDLLPRAHLARVEDRVEIHDPNNILTVAEDTDGGVRLGVSGATGTNSPETGATISIALRDVSGREIGPMQSSGLRSPMLAHFFAEEIEGWLSKADGAGNTYWIGLADGPLSEAQNAILWLVRNDEAGKQRVGLQILSNGTWQTVSTASNAHEDIVGVAGGGGSHTAANQMNVLGFASPIGNDSLSAHSYWVTNYGGVTLAPGKTPYLLVGAGCDGTSDTVEVKARAVAVVTANPDNLVPSGSPPLYVPGHRVFPPFESAVVHANPGEVLASASDLPNGVKKITLNAPAGSTGTVSSGAYWIWPFQNVDGNVLEDVYDLRGWEGTTWVDVLVPPATRPTGWWVAVGIIFGDELASSAGYLAGITWNHVWGQAFARSFFNGGNGWNENQGGSTHPDARMVELSWLNRGVWLAYPHANLLDGAGQPFSNFTMAGNVSAAIQVPQTGKPAHLVLAVGNHNGVGAADEILIRPAHSFRRKRF